MSSINDIQRLKRSFILYVGVIPKFCYMHPDAVTGLKREIIEFVGLYADHVRLNLGKERWLFYGMQVIPNDRLLKEEILLTIEPIRDSQANLPGP